MFFKRTRIRSYEIGLHFREGDFVKAMRPGKRWVFDPLFKHRVDVVSRRNPWLSHDKLDLIVKSNALEDIASVVDLKDDQRGLVWIDGRFDRVLGPGLYVYFNDPREVRVEVVDTQSVRFDHPRLQVIAQSSSAASWLKMHSVDRDHVGVLFVNGRYVETLSPGLYAFWTGTKEARIVQVDTRESAVDVAGQEIMTADKVSLRLNAMVVFRVMDARKSVSAATDVCQSLYRETQLALRAIIGSRSLDAFLSEKDSVATEIERALSQRAGALGLVIESVGIRDVILPGDMKELMNKVTEAKKAAEANLISRREETAAMRSQANTAKLLTDNPTLMRLRELEVLEKIASSSNLNVVLGEKGLTERVVNVL